MERGGGGVEVSQEVGSRGQFSSAPGAGRWQRYSVHGMGEPAMPNEPSGACRRGGTGIDWP